MSRAGRPCGACRAGVSRTKYAIYENPITRQFTVFELPAPFVAGDRLPLPPTARWFVTREDAMARLLELFELDEGLPAPAGPEAGSAEGEK